MGSEIKCSNGWLDHFKVIWNIKWQAMSGEVDSVDIDSAEKGQKNVAPIFTHHAPKDDFNMDLTTILRHSAEEDTGFKREKCEGWKGMRTKWQFCCVVMQMEGKNFVR
jgi:hypothetical protein